MMPFLHASTTVVGSKLLLRTRRAYLSEPTGALWVGQGAISQATGIPLTVETIEFAEYARTFSNRSGSESL
jgi:hypothetical protein